MISITRLAAVALILAPALAIRPREPRGSPHPYPTFTYGTAIGGALDLPEPTEAPTLVNRGKALDAPFLTVKVLNGFGQRLPISYNSNQGSPTIVGNPGAGTLAISQETAIAIPRDFAGAIFIGQVYDPANSKIEVSFSSPQGYRPGLDVSYVDGYSVPITCSCGGRVVTGCNTALFRTGRTCPRQGPGDRLLCHNPKKTVDNGPADPFFQPCQGAAYTYPNDHGANAFGDCDSGDIRCCVGINCPRNPKQYSKRDLQELYGYANETEIPAGFS
ncbi:MAG: hypothetical protein Q9185_006027 [Variospora sp. 1 TL-2023]